jgi:tetratricopeptide (TPR) repeat protein
MIENELTPESRKKEFIADVPEFVCYLPHPNPFVVGTSVRLHQHGQTLSWDWRYRAPSKPIAPLWGEVAESLLSRTMRDAKRFPKSARAHANAGAAFFGQGALEKAAEEFDAALRCDAKDVAALGGLARVRLVQGDLEAAKDLYKRLRAENPGDVSGYLGLAHVAMLSGGLDDAVILLQGAAACETGSSLARYHLALLLLKLNREREAIGHLRSAIRHDVRWPAMHEALAVAYVLAGSLRKAEKEFKTALRLIPNNERASRGLGEVLYRLGEKSDAIDVLYEALTRQPQDIKARELIARIYESESNFKRAREQLLQAEPMVEREEGDQRSRIFNNIGVCSSFLARPRSAGEWFARSIDSAPRASAIPYLNSARLDIELSHYDSAISALRLCQARFPEAEPRLAPLLAACLVQTGREIEAAQELRRIVKKGMGTSLAYAMLGGIVVEGEIRDVDGAIAVLEEGYGRYPRDSRIGNNLAYAYLQAGLPGRARTVLEGVNRDQETEVVLTATWGLLRLWEGERGEGEDRYKQAEMLARRKQHGQLADQVRQKMHLELARYYLRTGEFDKVLPEVRRGLSLKGRKSFILDLESLRTEMERIQ